jgi:hypothetical protein
MMTLMERDIDQAVARGAGGPCVVGRGQRGPLGFDERMHMLERQPRIIEERSR